MDRDRQINRDTNRQTNRLSNRQTYKVTDRQSDKQIEVDKQVGRMEINTGAHKTVHYVPLHQKTALSFDKDIARLQ